MSDFWKRSVHGNNETNPATASGNAMLSSSLLSSCHVCASSRYGAVGVQQWQAREFRQNNSESPCKKGEFRALMATIRNGYVIMKTSPKINYNLDTVNFARIIYISTGQEERKRKWT